MQSAPISVDQSICHSLYVPNHRILGIAVAHRIYLGLQFAILISVADQHFLVAG